MFDIKTITPFLNPQKPSVLEADSIHLTFGFSLNTITVLSEVEGHPIAALRLRSHTALAHGASVIPMLFRERGYHSVHCGPQSGSGWLVS